MRKKRSREATEAAMFTCFRRNELLFAVRQWVRAKGLRRGVRAAEAEMLEKAKGYLERG